MAPTPALVALFNGFLAGTNGLHVARLYTITLFGGGVIRFTDADFDINGNSTSALVNGFKYSSQGVRVDQKESKTQAHFKVGTDTDTWTLVVMPRPFDTVTGAAYPDQIGGVPWLQAAQGGALDAADFQVDEAYFSAIPTWPMAPAGVSPVGCRTIFAGTVAEVDTTNAVAVLTVNDYRSLFTIQMPLHFYQAQCRHTLFDNGCMLSAATFAINGVVGAGSTQAVIIGSGLAVPAGSATYTLGRIVFTGGKNNTFQRTIKNWDGAQTLSLLNPLPFPVSAGDTFTAYPGCNKLFTVCGQFNNQVNYGGQPFIPAPEVQGG
jgi:Phage conserved hypothetical protein BR0599/Uncharacterized conserved protein (DUF2163)